MESVELGFGGSSDEVESTAVFSSDLLAEAGPFLSSDEQKAIEALPSGSALICSRHHLSNDTQIDANISTVAYSPPGIGGIFNSHS